MASSSTRSQSPWEPTSQALWVRQDPAMDHNRSFARTQHHFEARVEALRVSGASVKSKAFDTFKKLASYIRTTYPNGIDLLGFRMHADEKSLPLSTKRGGVYSLAHPEMGIETVRKVLGSVRKFLMIEGCKTGFGKKGILKHVVGLCRSGVIGIGSRGSEFEVAFDPGLPGFMRFECLQSNQDITRIYYKAENGETQNIPSEELMLLWDFFKDKCQTPEDKQRGFELCYKLLGERNNPSAFYRIRKENQEFIDSILGDFKTIREQLLQVKVAKSGIKPIWMDMLKDLEEMRKELGGQDPIEEIAVDETERRKTPDQVVVLSGLRVVSWTSYQKVYRFILGCAFIDKYKPLLMLLDDEMEYGFASQAIKALSGLTIHGADELSITSMLAYYFPIIKKSYLAGKNSYLLRKWFEGISKGVCFNQAIKFIDDFYEERIRPSREERLRIAALSDDGEEVAQLIEQGVNVEAPELQIRILQAEAIDRGSFFIAYLLHQCLSPREEAVLMDELRLEYQKRPHATGKLDREVFKMIKYLSGKGEVEKAQKYADLIVFLDLKLEALCVCASGAAAVWELETAIEIINSLSKSQAPAYLQSDPSLDLLTRVVCQILDLALNLQQYSDALQVAQIFKAPAIQNEAGGRLFDRMLEHKPLDEVISFFESSFGSFVLYHRIDEFLEKGDVDGAVKITSGIIDRRFSNQARAKIVDDLLKRSKTQDAFIQAMKITEQSTQNECLFRLIESLVQRLTLEEEKGRIEEVVHYFNFIKTFPKHSSQSFIGFLCAERLGSEEAAMFFNKFKSACMNARSHFLRFQVLELTKQIRLIFKYLLGTGDFARAVAYAELVKTPSDRFDLYSLCASALADTGDLTQAYEMIRDKVFPLSKSSRLQFLNQYHLLVSDLINKGLAFKNFKVALDFVHLLPASHLTDQIDATRRIFEAMVSEMPIKDVVCLVIQSVVGPAFLSAKVKELSAEGKLDEAYEIAVAAKEPGYFDSMHVEMVNYLVGESQIDEAFSIAKKIFNDRERDHAFILIAQKYIDLKDPYSSFNVALSMTDFMFKLTALKLTLDLMNPDEQRSQMISFVQQIGPAAYRFLDPIAQRYREQGEFAFVLEIGQAIQDQRMIDEAMRELIKKGDSSGASS